MGTEVYILSCERPELLACALGSVCGFNAGAGPVHVIDDGSRDPRVAALLARYREARLIESVEIQPHGGVGRIRRRMIDRFLAGDADQLVQVEADMLVGPGQITALTDAYGKIKEAHPALHVLNVVWFRWVRPMIAHIRAGDYEVAITKGMSEPMWTSDRESLLAAVNAGMIPADRPDLVLWVDRMGGATLLQPEIQCQHIGAGKASLLYGYFSWNNVVIRQGGDAGPLRQPFPEHPLSWPAFQDEMPGSALRLYEYLRATSPVALPENPRA